MILKNTLLLLVIFSFISCTKDNNLSTVLDKDNNRYHFVKIGNQTWLDQNLRVTHYQNGDPVHFRSSPSEWASMNYGAYSVLEDSSLTEQFGLLYNWYVIYDTRKICPLSWHVPTIEDWNELIGFLGGTTQSGGKLKTIGNAFWQSPNTGASNESGFSALPSGLRDLIGLYQFLKQKTYFWSSSLENENEAWSIFLEYNSSNTQYELNDKKSGFSIRCIKN